MNPSPETSLSHLTQRFLLRKNRRLSIYSTTFVIFRTEVRDGNFRRIQGGTGWSLIHGRVVLVPWKIDLSRIRVYGSVNLPSQGVRTKRPSLSGRVVGHHKYQQNINFKVSNFLPVFGISSCGFPWVKESVLSLAKCFSGILLKKWKLFFSLYIFINHFLLRFSLNFCLDVR